MEQTQSTIQQLCEEIRAKEKLLEGMECEQLKKDLTDSNRNITCTNVVREGMGHFFGKHFNRHSRTAVEQQLILTFEVPSESVDKLSIEVDMTVTLCDDGDLYETEISTENKSLMQDCDWLYLTNADDEEIDDKYADELEELDAKITEEFDEFASQVKKVMNFLREKRKDLAFVD